MKTVKLYLKNDATISPEMFRKALSDAGKHLGTKLFKKSKGVAR